MKALTIKQPWASLIMSYGKDIENRQWHTSFRGRVAITASKKLEKSEVQAAWHFCKARALPLDWMDQPYPVGVILGTVEIIDCVGRSDSKWFVGDFGFVLRDPVVVAEPIPVRGLLGLWELPEEISKAIAPPEPVAALASCPDGFLPIQHAPKEAIDVELWHEKWGEVRVGHFAQGGGEDQPRFGPAYFFDAGHWFDSFHPQPTHFRLIKTARPA